MAVQRLKLSKKFFMTLVPGQYIMDNYAPSRYEKIGKTLEDQWGNWRGINGNVVSVFDSKEECLKAWWGMNSGHGLPLNQLAVWVGKLSRNQFLNTPSGYYLLFTQGSLEYIKLEDDRSAQWLQYKDRGGRMVEGF